MSKCLNQQEELDFEQKIKEKFENLFSACNLEELLLIKEVLKQALENQGY